MVERASILAILVTLVGCDGVIGEPTSRLAPGGGGQAQEEPIGDAFTLRRDDVELLPFSVRLRRVADVAGVGIDDPILERLRSRRISLGDHDFANGVAPDRTWTAAKLAAWVEALEPVCASDAVRTRYAALDRDVGPLVQAAYGRRPTPDDQADVDAAFEGTSPTPEQRAQTVCLAVLSSLEFVSQ
jgi:hypothetical protein